jgi:hypothetical protein
MSAIKHLSFIYFILILLGLSSCVSRKKYKVLQGELSLKEENFKKERTQYLSLNDSLKYLVVYKDSVIDSLNNRLNEAASKKEKSKTFSGSYKKSILTKDQEYEKKSLFIYNFTKHIEWPIEFNGTEFIIGVAGDELAIKRLENFMQQKKVSGKKILVEKYKKGARYNLVYITSAQNGNFQMIWNAVRKNKTLIVTDDFMQGGHISFTVDLDKVKYIVDKPAIEKTGLKVAQELIRYSGQ